jgi:acyl dehydratase
MALEGLYFEDFSPGKIYATHRRTITETDLISFMTLCGFYEPLFVDQGYVEKETAYGRRIVPGALTMSYAEGLSILSGILHHTGMAFLGMELAVLKPVFVGDTIGVEIEVIEKRETQKPDRGIVTFIHRVINQKGERVLEYKVKRMIRRKSSTKMREER